MAPRAGRLALLSLLLGAAPGDTAALSSAIRNGPNASGGKTGAPAGDYEEYVLALEWQPSWSAHDCSQGGPNRVTDHTGMPDGAHARGYLSLHGLWPNYAKNLSKHGGYDWPQFCDATGTGGPNFTVCAANTSLPVCMPDDASVSRFNVSQTGWQQWALEYAWGDLAGHEWGKHGGCSAWSSPASDQQAYWAVQAEALANITAGLGSTLVHQSVGGNSSFVALEQAFRQDVGGAKPLLSCNGMCELTQVWLGFSAEPTTLRPQVEPRFGRDARGSAAPTDCATCDDVHVPAWSGCPPAPPPPSPNPP